MRQLLDGLRKELEAFIVQRDDLLMVAASSADESAIVLRLLRDLEQSQGSDVFLLFADDFVQATPFVSVVIERLRMDHRLASEALREEGREPLREMPERLFDAARPPAERLREAIGFAGSLLPPGGGHRLVWAMFPQRVADRDAYLRLVYELAPWRGVEPWMRGVRLIVRADPEDVGPQTQLARAPRVRLRRMDAGPAALENSLRGDADNEALPDDDRMQSMFLLASLDYAHHRTDDAVARYKVLLGHYQHTGDHTMQAYVINALGDIFHRSGDLQRAQYWYECAIEPASNSKQPVVLATVVRNLADVAYGRGQYSDAEQYYGGSDTLAAAMLDPDGKARALEKRGLSQEQQGAWDRAVTSWEAAVTLSRSVGMPERLRGNLGHLARGYRMLGMNDRATAAEAEERSLAGQEDVR